MEKKFEAFENRIELLKKTVVDKEQEISFLEQKLNTIENSFDTKLKALETKIKTSLNRFKCDKCDFSTISENGLKTHNTKKHKDKIQISEDIFPKQCSVCDLLLNNKKEMAKHMRTHSYKFVQYQCEHCDFIGGEEIDMEVHIAKLHGDMWIVDCGLWIV